MHAPSIAIMHRLRAFALAMLACCAPGAAAQAFPVKPLRLVVPFAAGGGTDVVGRTVAQKLGERIGQSVVVDNRAGAGGIIGTEAVARAPADGYTLLMGSNGPLAILPGLRSRLPYDAARDLAPVTLICVMPSVWVVHPVLPVKTMKDLVALARARPGQLNYGSPGSGTTNHLAGELLRTMASIDIAHVPYKGVAPAVTDLIAGQIQMMSGDLSTVMPQIKAGRVRAIATTGLKRSALMPDVPTVAESGVPGYDSTGWFGVLVPAGTERDVIQRLHGAIVQGLGDADARARLAALGGEIVGAGPEPFGQHLRAETAKWARIIAAANVRLDGAP